MESPAAPDRTEAAHSLLDSAARVVIVGRHSVPILRAWAGLIRAEGDVARDSVSGILIAAGIAAFGVFVVFTALIGGAMLGLREIGWPVWAATALPAGVGIAVAIAASGFAYVRFHRLTFPETRRRLGVLLEVLDEP
jgi:sterol desaturase/sphingolipid hydroxylase (fatty acid hydroxylase superfamily)